MKVPALLAALAFAGALGVQPVLRRGVRELPPLATFPDTPFILQDVGLAAAGLRAVAADLAWIQLLQYMADGIPEMRDSRPYEHVATMSLRVARLDPSFHRAYLYAAGILAWFPEVDRPDEALEVLKEGMREDPDEPLYRVYIAALAYKRRGDADRMIALLEPTMDDPRSPIIMKDIVANLYKARGDYARALEIWNGILDSELEAREWPRARVQVKDIERLMRERRAGRPAPPRK
jgi:tetratricopeptide (TPR) repeat protein